MTLTARRRKPSYSKGFICVQTLSRTGIAGAFNVAGILTVRDGKWANAKAAALLARIGGNSRPGGKRLDVRQGRHLVAIGNSQAPPLDGYAERSSTSSFGGMVSARRMLTPCFRAVEMTERM